MLTIQSSENLHVMSLRLTDKNFGLAFGNALAIKYTYYTTQYLAPKVYGELRALAMVKKFTRSEQLGRLENPWRHAERLSTLSIAPINETNNMSSKKSQTKLGTTLTFSMLLDAVAVGKRSQS